MESLAGDVMIDLSEVVVPLFDPDVPPLVALFERLRRELPEGGRLSMDEECALELAAWELGIDLSPEGL